LSEGSQVGVIAWIVVGLIAGWLANMLLKGRGGGLLGNLAVGLVGAIIGGWLFGAVGIISAPGFGPQLVSATIGAIVLLLYGARSGAAAKDALAKQARRP
jgi:uncharacterized membrane protein YeaQ/YmgE (transglycosylase-associated protein family)